MKRIILISTLLCIYTLSANAQLTIDNATFFIQSGATVTVQGNLTSNVSIQGTGLLQLKGSTLQTVDMGGQSIPNLELDNTSNASIVNTNTRIGSSLLLTNGKIQTGNLNLILSPTAAITGANSSRFVWTNGTGQLKKELTADIISFELPVGENANYRPAYLTTSGSSFSAADFGVKVSGIADPNKPNMSASFLNTYWSTTRTGITGGTVTLAGQYIDPTDVAGTEANLFGYYYNGTDWSSAGETHNTATNRVSATVSTNSGSLSGINKFLQVGARALLQGAYSSITGLMTDNLRALPFGSSASTANFPSTDPYRVAPYTTSFTHLNNAGIETIPNSGVIGAVAITGDRIVDWVFLELRNLNNPPGHILQTRSALIQRDGDIVDVDGVSPVTFNNMADGNYLIAVRHRNHLGLGIDQTSPRALNEIKSTAFTTNVIDFRNATDAQLHGTSVAFATAAHPVLGTANLLWGGNGNYNTATRASGPTPQNDYLFLLSITLGGNVATIIPNIYSSADMNLDRQVRAGGPTAQNDYLLLLSIVLGGDVTKTINQQLL